MPRMAKYDGKWNVKYIQVTFDENGDRHEMDFYSLPKEERELIRKRNNERCLKAAGYVKSDNTDLHAQ